MKIVVIENYSDLEKVSDNLIVDISKLSPKLSLRAIDFLLGLTYKFGSLKRIERCKYLVRIGDNNGKN
nr:cell division protein SepF [Bacilli bacterium]